MTWSIVARDPATGSVGCAVASRFFGVGAIVPWTQAGVGMVCTQAMINPYLGARTLALMASGMTARAAIDALIASETHREQRQLHALALDGPHVAFTGAACVDWAGHLSATDAGVAGNMLAGPQVLEATLEAYQASHGRPLAERLLRAMSAGEAAGGDRRGKQSAAIRVQGREVYAEVNLRVDDHPEPVAELWRLYQVGHQRYYAFHTGMPTLAEPDGVADRDALERRIQAWLEQHGNVDFSAYWQRDPWREA